jgi:hypothetical protein
MMWKPRKNYKMEFFSGACCLFVVIIAASSLSGNLSTAQLIGLIAGSFGAGAAFTNAIRGYFDRRKNQS